MPELPDVATFSEYIKRTSLHQPIDHTSVLDSRILQGVTPRKLAARLKNRELTTTRRHGKFLFVRVGRDGWLVLHFGMTGELSYYKNGETPQYTCLLLSFRNGYHLAYLSRRKLGQVGFTRHIQELVEEHDLGPDAMDDQLTAGVFSSLLSDRKGTLKSTLMNQSVIAGIGNVYSDEILFQAGLHPETPVDQLDDRQITHLYRVLRRVLDVASRKHAQVSRFPRGYLLRTRDERVCPRCGGELEKQTVGGRSSYVCTNCQPVPVGK